MSEKNVELVRRTTDLFNAREIEQALDGVHDDFVMDWSNSIGPLKGIYRGRQGALKLWSSFLDAWDAVQWDPEEIIEVECSESSCTNRKPSLSKPPGCRNRPPMVAEVRVTRSCEPGLAKSQSARWSEGRTPRVLLCMESSAPPCTATCVMSLGTTRILV